MGNNLFQKGLKNCDMAINKNKIKLDSPFNIYKDIGILFQIYKFSLICT